MRGRLLCHLLGKFCRLLVLSRLLGRQLLGGFEPRFVSLERLDTSQRINVASRLPFLLHRVEFLGHGPWSSTGSARTWRAAVLYTLYAG